jgi:hypothetical protein
MWNYLKWFGAPVLLLISILIHVNTVVHNISSYIIKDQCQCSIRNDCTVRVLVQVIDDSRVWVDTFVICPNPKPKLQMKSLSEEIP